MADQLVTSLDALTTTASTDILYIVDVSDTTDHASGTSKKITLANLRAAQTDTSPPGTTPDFVGEIFVNTSTGQAWVAVGTNSSSDWKEVMLSV